MIDSFLQFLVVIFNFVIPLVSYVLLIGADLYMMVIPKSFRFQKIVGGILGLISLILVIVVNLYTQFLKPFDVPVPLTLLVFLIVIATGILAGFGTLLIIKYLFIEQLAGFIMWAITAGLLISAYFFVASQNIRVLMTLFALTFLMGNFIFLLFSGLSWIRELTSTQKQSHGDWQSPRK